MGYFALSEYYSPVRTRTPSGMGRAGEKSALTRLRIYFKRLVVYDKTRYPAAQRRRTEWVVHCS